MELGKFRGQKDEIIKKTRDNTAFEKGRQDTKLDPWPRFSCDMQPYIDTLAFYFQDAACLPARIKKLREESGQPVAVVEVCGAADAQDIGADWTVNLTLTDTGMLRGPKQTILTGDIYNSVDVGKFLKKVDEIVASKNLTIGCVIMIPVGGIIEYFDIELGWIKLYRLLQALYERLPDGGEIYSIIPHTTYDTTNFEMADFLELLNKPGEEKIFDIVRESHQRKKAGSRCAFHITKRAHVLKELPTFGAVAKR